RGDRRVHPGAWRWLAIGLAVLWLGTLAWALRERRRAGAHARRLPLVQPRGDAPAPATSLRALREVLVAGDARELEAALGRLPAPADAAASLLPPLYPGPRM